MNIPPTAEMMAEGNGSVSAQAPHDGLVYVYDSVTAQLVYSGPVARGAMVAVDRPNDQIMVDGKVVLHNASKSSANLIADVVGWYG